MPRLFPKDFESVKSEYVIIDESFPVLSSSSPSSEFSSSTISPYSSEVF